MAMDEIIPGIGPTTGTIPQTVPTNMPDIGAVLSKAGVTNPAAPNANVIAQILSQLTKKTSAMPGAGQPLSQKQYPQIQDSTTGREFRAVGSNKRSAIGDIFTNIGSMVKTARQNKEAQEARTLSVDLERIMIASQDLPDPSGKTPPTPEQQKNQQIINDVLSDPKKRKQVEKALDISFMGEDKRDKVSKNAMDSALKKVQSMSQGGGTTSSPMSEQIPGVGGTPTNIGGIPGQVPPQQQGGGTGVQMPPQRQMSQQQQRPDYASQLMKQLPQTSGKIPSAILEQLIKGETELTKESMKSNTELLKTAMINNNKLQLAEIVANSKSKTDLTSYLRTIEQTKGKKYAIDVMSAASVKRAQIMVDGYTERAKTTGKPDKETEEAIKQANSLMTAIKQAADQVKNTPSEWFGLSSKKKDEARARLKDLQDQYEKLQQFINQKRLNRGMNDGGISTRDRGSTEFNADDFVNSFDDFKAVTGGEE